MPREMWDACRAKPAYRLERQSKSVDDGPQDFKHLADAIVALRLINETVKRVADRLSDKTSVRHELACERRRGKAAGKRKR